ncbi:MAG: hypothetical protein K8R88_10200 [Armatimonadetes bacterium]|nr:hypothetical protein [Armatimonadota bacterium]
MARIITLLSLVGTLTSVALAEAPNVLAAKAAVQEKVLRDIGRDSTIRWGRTTVSELNRDTDLVKGSGTTIRRTDRREITFTFEANVAFRGNKVTKLKVDYRNREWSTKDSELAVKDQVSQYFTPRDGRKPDIRFDRFRTTSERNRDVVRGSGTVLQNGIRTPFNVECRVNTETGIAERANIDVKALHTKPVAAGLSNMVQDAIRNRFTQVYGRADITFTQSSETRNENSEWKISGKGTALKSGERKARSFRFYVIMDPRPERPSKVEVEY